MSATMIGQRLKTVKLILMAAVSDTGSSHSLRNRLGRRRVQLTTVQTIWGPDRTISEKVMPAVRSCVG